MQIDPERLGPQTSLDLPELSLDLKALRTLRLTYRLNSKKTCTFPLHMQTDLQKVLAMAVLTLKMGSTRRTAGS